METYLVSFGSDYKRKPHPVLGYWPLLGDDAVLSVEADDKGEAREKVHALIGPAWCAIYGPTDSPGWDYRYLGSLYAAVKDPKPKDWTVGVSVTVDTDGKLTLNLEDLTLDLTSEGAALSVIADLEDRMTFWQPSVVWVKREPSTP